jgi:hypothetical protein
VNPPDSYRREVYHPTAKPAPLKNPEKFLPRVRISGAPFRFRPWRQAAMRIGWLALVVVAGAWGHEQEVAVGLENAQMVPFVVLAQAEATAARIYAGVGVKIVWRSRQTTAIWMKFDTGVTAAVHPGAMGYATPYGGVGTCIHVLLDRVRSTGSQRLEGLLLGHVMAHELGHVLEGISRHSDSGIMKARWEDRDFDQMLVRPLSFSAEDVDLIQMGAAKWAARQS